MDRANVADQKEDGVGRGFHPVQVIGATSDEISPLVLEVEGSINPKISIFSISSSGSRSRINKELALRTADNEVSTFTDIMLWTWGGSRYSGLICMVLTSCIYFMMDALTKSSSARTVPLSETIFSRCFTMLILSYLWLRKMGQTSFGPADARAILVLRALVGYLSLACFIYSFHNLPHSYALLINLLAPAVAFIGARIVFKEKSSLMDIGGLACSISGILLIYHPLFGSPGGLTETQQQISMITDREIGSIYAAVAAIFSSATGGITYCLIKSGAKATDQPVMTVLAFGALACPISAISTLYFERFVLLDLYSIFISLVLGILAFFGEVFLARGLQLEKTSKAMNILYLKVFLTEMWNMASLNRPPTFSGLMGCLLIVASSCSALYVGSQRETG